MGHFRGKKGGLLACLVSRRTDFSSELKAQMNGEELDALKSSKRPVSGGIATQPRNPFSTMR